jgi:hypothetical protein
MYRNTDYGGRSRVFEPRKYRNWQYNTKQYYSESPARSLRWRQKRHAKDHTKKS